MRLDRISRHGEAPGMVRAVIETPRGSRNKYKFEPDIAAMTLSKVMPEGHVFPFDFGFFPRTKGEDGDPIDVLVLMDEPVVPGCVVDCRLIGMFRINQTERGRTVRNDRFLAVAMGSLNFRRLRDVRDLDRDMLEQIRHFFVSYAGMVGKKVKILRTLGAAAARKALQAATEQEL